MSLALRSLHDLPSPTGTIDRRYPLGNAPVVSSSPLGINLTAFQAANFNLSNLPQGTPVDFNYRQFLTGTSASTAVLTVNATAGTLGSWVIDATAAGISNNTGSFGSGSLIVTASNGVDPAVSFPVQIWSILSPVQQTAVKLFRGNGFWPNNSSWSSTGKSVYSSSILPLTRSNTNLTLIEMVMSWADMEGAVRGDYSPAFNSIQAVLNDAAAITTHKVGVIVKGWLTFFGSPANPPSRTSSSMWPAYVASNGWVTSFIQNGSGRNQLTWDVDDVWTALTSMFVAIGSRFNSHPNFAGLGYQDETEAVSIIDSAASLAATAAQLGIPSLSQPAPWSPSATVINSTHYCTKLLAMFLAMSDAMPNTPCYVPWNFLPPGGASSVTTMCSMIQTMISTRPGKWIFGGPDPWTHGTTYHQVACGLSGTLGDMRSQVIQYNNVEQGTETGTGNPTATAIYAKAVGTGVPVLSPLSTPGRAQMLIWPYIPDNQGGQITTVSDILAAIAANNNQVAPIPTVGTYILAN